MRKIINSKTKQYETVSTDEWTLDDEPTAGSFNGITSDAVSKAIGNLGQPLQWKGSATVAELNAGPEGVQPGWTYTLTDAGTLTDGSVDVEPGDEVAWTEDGEWFKVGGENSSVALFQFTGTDYPDGDAVLAEQVKGKTVVLVRYITGYGGSTYDYYYLNYRVAGTIGGVSATYLEFYPVDNSKKYIKAFKDLDAAEPSWVWTLEDNTLGAIKNGGSLTDGASVTVPNNALSTLSTAQATLTLNVNLGSDEVPNFAVEVTPSVNCTLTVTKTVGDTVTTLNPSVAGGDELTDTRKYQVTCVGSCWTLAEFEVPV